MKPKYHPTVPSANRIRTISNHINQECDRFGCILKLSICSGCPGTIGLTVGVDIGLGEVRTGIFIAGCCVFWGSRAGVGFICEVLVFIDSVDDEAGLITGVSCLL